MKFNIFKIGKDHYIQTDKAADKKREALIQIFSLLRSSGFPNPAMEARFSKNNPSKWNDKEVNYYFNRLKALVNESRK